ncbi:MAG: hypothetical protein ACKO2G_12655 [Verrucomicrobiales bacterium]
MKTTTGPLGGLSRVVGQLAGFLFGKIQWSAPPWARWLAERFLAFGALLRRNPRAAMLSVAVLAALSFGGWKWWQWWESHRPREFAYQPEQEVAVGVVAPPEAPRTEKDEDVPPLPLRITFSLPAAPIELVGKSVTDVATLSPAIKGSWTWENNKELFFLPEARWWPAGQAFKVTLRPQALATGMKYSATEVAFTTPPLKLQVSAFNFHTEPQDPTIQLVWGEVWSNYPRKENGHVGMPPLMEARGMLKSERFGGIFSSAQEQFCLIG